MDSEIIINLSKTYILVATFSLNNADFPPLTPLSPRKPVSSRISVLPCKSVHNFFKKSVQKPSYISYIKLVYNISLGARNECVHVSGNRTMCKASVTDFGECAINVGCKLIFYPVFLSVQFLFHLLML